MKSVLVSTSQLPSINVKMSCTNMGLLGCRSGILQRPVRNIVSRIWFTTNAIGVPFKEDVPIVVVNHTIKKAYVVNDMVTMANSTPKYCWLTKTSVAGEIPRNFNGQNVSDETVNNYHAYVAQNAKRKIRTKQGKRLYDTEQRLGLLYGLCNLGICEARSKKDPSEFYLDSDPLLKTHWMRTFDYYQLKCSPSFALRSTNPLPPLPDGFEVDASNLEQPGPYDTYALNMFRHPTIKLHNDPGYFNSKDSPYRYIHSLFVSTRLNNIRSNLVAGSILHCFAHLLSEALDRGELFGTQLAEPVFAQCVATDGESISFLVYQLNTLSLQDDRGIWNYAWTAGPFPLLDRNDSSILDLTFVDYFQNVISRSL